MVSISKRSPLIVTAVALLAVIAPAQNQRKTELLSVQGCPGQAAVVQLQGRTLLDVQELARITNGSISFEKDRIVLTLTGCNASNVTGDTGTSNFSRPFTRAAIEAMASIREWGGMLLITVQNGYPVQNTMAGNTISAYQERAADSVALASTSASKDSDQHGLELLRNEFNNVQAWADKFAQARSSMSAANLTMSEGALKNDEEAQKIIHCGQFLAQMFAGGTFQDDAACH
jgi:hypothetical protein